MNRKFDANENFELLKNERNIAGRAMYEKRPSQEVKVQIYPDKSVSPAKFIPNQSMPGTFRAHPTTIAAMRSDLFANMHDEAFEELSAIITCSSCKTQIDQQFWKFCPYCEAPFPKNHG
ncbi:MULTISPECIES: hypothetical protein [Halobacteriovorax]|uniref:Zinc ribbon domain-containing protein n=1 Tax=Halobacteriovorax vibrionivorans TaxID=2152716 RepID=A0ABY0IE35_9BACT|nr:MULTISPECIES: hypothetical protein [Halobacteriovorax]AYF44784.1 hypothetical protein BALOs_1784 [Halobacteriovorax sp. BALOs_7]RZF20865.1 hypothetical protein DAY19_12845 [Halobacteriovorax vibrionivorans]TGD48249.1 hypothetical protein EP118_04945 [Halobacteriovorax sp. Y22]